MALRILVVDDTVEFRQFLGHILKAQFPDAQVAEHDPVSSGLLLPATGMDAQDVVILDYLLGKHTGMDVLRLMREQGLATPVIFVSALGNDEIAAQALELGAVRYLPKFRLTPAQLGDAVRAVTASP